jgi:hypothetical protein
MHSRFLHKSSIFIAPGFEDIRRLVKEGKIEAYLITARFSFLKADFEKWLVKMNAREIFKEIHLNEKDEQPHLYKAALVEKYKLDVFVDDNWDIIRHLHESNQVKNSKVLAMWIYNFLDRHLDYQHKHATLKSAMYAIEKYVKAK